MGWRARLIGLLALVAALVAAAFLFTGRDASLVRRLPDGSYLRIVSVEYGSKHSYTLPALKPWQSFLARYLPASWVNRFAWREGKASVSSSAQPGVNTLAVVTLCEQMSPSSFGSPQLVLLDERGVGYSTGRPSAVAGAMAGNHRRNLIVWSFSDLPTVDKPLRLCFSFNNPDPAGKARQSKVEFQVANPIPTAAK